MRISGALKLVKLSGFGLARLGATAEVTHGGLPYEVPQAWSRAIHDLDLKPDGIAYNARHDDEALCYAIFDRASTIVEERSREANLDQDWFWRLAESYGVALAPPTR